ncbi:hypothetical protein SAMN05421765_2744 [Kaistella antarctica]|uniref:Uncharacterized protein n=1 Tax=Kaistella antarctica TaxID=266748 RepID=A0A448NRH2_9FLAO|nr:hypothetical protein SAMN05421765_2744 [Kaistella antarctica]VEH99509.1 Uncharacterised protein [Kaistella antarctica]
MPANWKSFILIFLIHNFTKRMMSISYVYTSVKMDGQFRSFKKNYY